MHTVHVMLLVCKNAKKWNYNRQEMLLFFYLARRPSIALVTASPIQWPGHDVLLVVKKLISIMSLLCDFLQLTEIIDVFENFSFYCKITYWNYIFLSRDHCFCFLGTCTQYYPNIHRLLQIFMDLWIRAICIIIVSVFLVHALNITPIANNCRRSTFSAMNTRHLRNFYFCFLDVGTQYYTNSQQLLEIFKIFIYECAPST